MNLFKTVNSSFNSVENDGSRTISCNKISKNI